MAELARANAASSDAKPAVTVCAGDLLDPPDAVSSMTFDHVMTNPPYMPLARGTPASARGRGARQEGHVKLAGWIRRCCALTARRSEEHTSELQSLMRTSYAVVCLKKTIITQ